MHITSTKRLLSVLTVAALSAGLAACGDDTTSTSDPTGAGDPASTSGPAGTSDTGDTTTSTTGSSGPSLGEDVPRWVHRPCEDWEPKPLPDGAECRTIEVDGYPREYVLYVPEALGDSDEPAPLVVMHHGSTGNGQQFSRISGWVEKADEEGFVAAFPTGLQYFVTDEGKGRWSTKWHSYALTDEIDVEKRLPGYPADAPWPADDVSFEAALIDDVSTVHALDETRLYASGFSNGSAFASRLAVEMDETFAAAAGSGGGIGIDADVPDAEADTVLPMWMLLGSRDEKFAGPLAPMPYPTSAEDLQDGMGNGALRMPNAMRELWGLPTEPCDVKETASTTTLQWCDEDASEFRFTMIEDMTHVYPNGENNSAGVAAVDLFWPFFEQYTQS